MMKKIIFLIVLIVLVVAVAAVLLGYSIVIYRQEAPVRNYAFQTGQIVNPLKDFNFSDGEWTAFVVFSNDDRSRLPAGIKNSTVIRCADRAVLKQLQDQVEFDYSDSDTATVTSRILLFKNHLLMFDSGLVVEAGTEGFQSRDFGWMASRNPGSLAIILSKFQRVWSPLVTL